MVQRGNAAQIIVWLFQGEMLPKFSVSSLARECCPTFRLTAKGEMLPQFFFELWTLKGEMLPKFSFHCLSRMCCPNCCLTLCKMLPNFSLTASRGNAAQSADEYFRLEHKTGLSELLVSSFASNVEQNSPHLAGGCFLHLSGCKKGLLDLLASVRNIKTNYTRLAFFKWKRSPHVCLIVEWGNSAQIFAWLFKKEMLPKGLFDCFRGRCCPNFPSVICDGMQPNLPLDWLRGKSCPFLVWPLKGEMLPKFGRWSGNCCPNRGLTLRQNAVHFLTDRLRRKCCPNCWLMPPYHLITLSPCHLPPYHLITWPPYHLITLSPYHLTTLSPFHLITLSPYHLLIFSPYHLITLSPYHLTTSSPYHLTTLSPYHLTTFSPSHLITLSPYHLTTLPPHYGIICSHCHLITLSPYHLIILSPYNIITLSPCHLTTLPPHLLIALPPYHLITLSPYHLTTWSPCHLATLPPYHLITLLLTTLPCHHLIALFSYHLIILSPYHLVTLSPYHLTTLSPYHLFTLSPFSPCHLITDPLSSCHLSC